MFQQRVESKLKCVISGGLIHIRKRNIKSRSSLWPNLFVLLFNSSLTLTPFFKLCIFLSDSKRPFRQEEPLLSWTPSKSPRHCSRSLLLQCFNGDADNQQRSSCVQCVSLQWVTCVCVREKWVNQILSMAHVLTEEISLTVAASVLLWQKSVRTFCLFSPAKNMVEWVCVWPSCPLNCLIYHSCINVILKTDFYTEQRVFDPFLKFFDFRLIVLIPLE